jgi:hypothetical protein
MCRNMIEALAYTLKTLASKQTWTAELTDDWERVPWSHCCSAGGRLPKEFIEAMRAADESYRQPPVKSL